VKVSSTAADRCDTMSGNKAKNPLEPTTTVAHHYLFGLEVTVEPSVLYLDEGQIVHPAGHNIAILNVENRRQKLIHGMPCDGASVRGITAMAMPPRRNAIVVAERGERAMLHVYDTQFFRKKKTLTTSEVMSNEYVSVAFSDNKTIISQGGAPDWTLVLWGLDKGKVLALAKVSNAQNSPIYHVSLCPEEPSMVLVTGDTIIKFFRVQDGAFKPVNPNLSKREPQNYLAHAWLPDDQAVVATDDAQLLLFENAELRTQWTTGEDGGMVNCIVTYSKGFICGGENGVIRVFEKSEDGREPYKRSTTLEIDDNRSRIKSMAVSLNEETLVLTTEDKQMYVLQLSNLDILKGADTNFELLVTPLHEPNLSGKAIVTGLDVCVRKPLLATCAADKSVRIWNYVDKTMELMRTFEEDPCSVAMHPSGLQVLVGFTDKLRLMNLLMDDISTFKEFSIKACIECRFSNGGDLFAAAAGNAINVYNVYTFACIAQLRGHNQKVLSVNFNPSGQGLLSAGMDGGVIFWDLTKGVRSGELNQKGIVYTSAVVGPNKEVLASGTDKLVKIIEYDTEGMGSVAKELESTAAIGQICLSNSGQTLFAGVTDSGRPGAVRVYSYPITGHFVEYQAHAGPITRVRVSKDDKWLFTCGEDGMVAVFNVVEQAISSDKKGKGAQGQKQKTEPLSFAEEILVTKSDLEEKRTRMNELKAKVEELTLHNEYQLRLKDMNYAEKIKEVTEKFTQELDADKRKYNLLMEEKDDMKLEYDYKIKTLRARQGRETEDLEANYQHKVKAEVDRYERLVQERDEMNQEWDDKNEMLVEAHQNHMGELTEEYENKLQEESENQQRIEEEKTSMINEFEENKGSVEEDADTEIEELKRKYEGKLAAEKNATLRLKGENGLMRKKFSALKKDIEDQREELKSMVEKQQQLYEKIKGLEKDIQGHKKEINERDETIQDKEKRIYDLKKKNQELEKFKFVLDYKIKELKRQIEPRENEIADMAQQIKEMDQELEQYHKSNAALDLMIGELRLKMEGMQVELDEQKKRLKEAEDMISVFSADLHTLFLDIGSYKKLKHGVTKMYKTHVQDAGIVVGKEAPGATGSVAAQVEFNRQREYLEKSVESLKRKLAKDMELHRADNMRLMKEGVILTAEINQLRREQKVSKAMRSGRTNSNPNAPQSNDRNFTPLPPEDGTAKDGGRGGLLSSRDSTREHEMQMQQVNRLRAHIAKIEENLGGPLPGAPKFDRESYLKH
jgi:cilia- and flagella-associated protein 57